MKARTSPETKSEGESNTVFRQDWSKFWFSDEKRYCMKGSKPHGIFLAWRKKVQIDQKAQHSGDGSLTIWGAGCNNSKLFSDLDGNNLS